MSRPSRPKIRIFDLEETLRDLKKQSKSETSKTKIFPNDDFKKFH